MLMENNLRENKMGTMPVGKLLFTMAWPMMLSMLFQALYNMVDEKTESGEIVIAPRGVKIYSEK